MRESDGRLGRVGLYDRWHKWSQHEDPVKLLRIQKERPRCWERCVQLELEVDVELFRENLVYSVRGVVRGEWGRKTGREAGDEDRVGYSQSLSH